MYVDNLKPAHSGNTVQCDVSATASASASAGGEMQSGGHSARSGESVTDVCSLCSQIMADSENLR